MKNIFYWSPFISKVATIQAVINSAHSINQFSKKNLLKASIIDAVHEWAEYEKLLKEKNIELIYLNKKSNLKSIKRDGFFMSRLLFVYIFFKSFFSLNKLLKKQKPDYLIIHLITSLPLILFCIFKYDTKLILRISGLPKLNFIRKMIWKLASKKIYKITCPTDDTYKDMLKYKFLSDKLEVLKDPIINIKDIKTSKKIPLELDETILNKINNKNFFLSIGRLTRQKNFLFYLECIPEILKINKDLFFLFIGQGEDKNNFLELAKKLNIADKIFLIDYTNNVHFFMSKSKAFVLTSLWEDPGFVLVESGYNNCQIISSDCPNGPLELIGNDGGYLFKSNSKTSFINAVKNFLNDTDKNKFFKKIVLKKRVKNFTSFQHFLKIKKILN
jgi:glycosyltransferase involved in cell wall biosynthesis